MTDDTKPDKAKKPKTEPVDGYRVLTDACTLAATGDWIALADVEAGINTAALIKAGHIAPEVKRGVRS